MLWNRRDYIDLMTGNHPKRQMFVELFGPLIGLEDEWRAQGASEDEISLSAFCFDSIPIVHAGSTGARDCFEPVTLEETEEYRIGRDYLGRTVKMCKKTATIPLPLDFPVKDMDDWRKLRHMFAFSPERVDLQQIGKAREAQEKGAMVLANIPGGFDTVRELMGEENCCIAYYEQPELIWDIMNTISDTSFRVLEEVTRHVSVDCLCIHEDMAGKHAPLVGPNIVDEFIKPYYRRQWDLVSDRGTKIFSQDSDGNMEAVMDSFIEAGVTVFYPCEPAAGMDIVKLRKKYGKKIAFKGGIDKHVLRAGIEEIDRELAYKLQPLMQEGGVVFGIDHRIPNGTPLENYRHYVKKTRELLGLPPLEEAEPGWARMAF